MNYLGSKKRLVPFIEEVIKSVVSDDLSGCIFCDAFAGTGAVGRYFKSMVDRVYANDTEWYSYILNWNYIAGHLLFDYTKMIDYLNNLPPVKGYIYKNYCLGGSNKRQYFTDNNGMKIDAINRGIYDIRNGFGNIKHLEDDEFYFLLASLLESADKVANTASTYYAYLKHVKGTAQKSLVLEPAINEVIGSKNMVFNTTANELVRKIEGDILYLDPPYNQRQYGAYYHLLNTIGYCERYNLVRQKPRGIAGVHDYYHSPYCSSVTALEAFDDLLKNAKFKYIFLSYNNEGIMSFDEIREVMRKYGKYGYAEKTYPRYTTRRFEFAEPLTTTEYIHILTK